MLFSTLRRLSPAVVCTLTLFAQQLAAQELVHIKWLGPPTPPATAITCMAFGVGGGRRMLTVEGARTTKIREARTSKELYVLHRSSGPVLAAAISPNGLRAALGISEPHPAVIIWDLDSQRERLVLPRLAHCLVFSPTGKWLAIGGKEGAELWDLANRKVAHILLLPGLAADGQADYMGMKLDDKVEVDALAFSSDGQRIAVGGSRRVCIYDCLTGKLIRQLRTAVMVRSMALSADGKYLAVVDSPLLRRAGEIAASTGRMTADAFLGSLAEGSVTVWELATGQEVLVINGGKREFGPLSFNPSGRLLVFADEASVQIWDIATGKRVATLKGHQSWVSGIAFQPGGKRIVSAGDDGLRMWDLDELGIREQRLSRNPGLDSLKTLVSDLSGMDGPKAHRAIWALTMAPEQVVPLLRDQVRPVRQVAPNRLASLIAALDSNHFGERRQAAEELEKLAERAEPALRSLLANSASLEARRSAEALLERLARRCLPGEELLGLRSVEVLERIATMEARDLLGRLAAGAPEARLTQEAQAALQRLRR